MHTKEEPPIKTLAELEQIKQEAVKRLQQREKEFQLISTLSKDNLSKYINGFDANTLVKVLTKEAKDNTEDLKRQLALDEPEEEQGLFWKDVPRRGDKKDDTKRTYVKLKDKFYDQISANRQKALLEELNLEKKRMSHPTDDEELENLNEKYYTTFAKYLKDQRTAETDRLRRNNLMGDMNEWRGLLLEKQDINKIKRWNWDLLTSAEQMQVTAAVRRKIRSLKDPGLQFEVDFDSDITKQVEAYLDDRFKKVDTDKIAQISFRPMYDKNLVVYH